MRTRTRIRASGLCARFPWCPVCVPVLVSWVTSCVVRGGVVNLSRLRGQVGHPGGIDISSGTLGVCLLQASKGAEQALLDAGHVLFHELGVVFGGGVWTRHSRVMRRAATMYWQSCMVMGCGGVGPVRFRGASLCRGRRVTFHTHCSAGICQVRWVHLARQYIALARPWLRLRMESSLSRDLRPHLPQMWGLSGSSSLVYVSWPGLCGGGVVGGEEEVGAVD